MWINNIADILHITLLVTTRSCTLYPFLFAHTNHVTQLCVKVRGLRLRSQLVIPKK